MDRRDALRLSSALLLGTVISPGAQAQSRPDSQGRTLGEHPLGEVFPGWQGSMREIVYPPGAASAAHQHPGPTFGYVVSGRVKWAINGEAPRVLGPGDAFFEPMGSVHSTSANASDSEAAKLAVVILGRMGEPLSKPAPKPGA